MNLLRPLSLAGDHQHHLGWNCAFRAVVAVLIVSMASVSLAQNAALEMEANEAAGVEYGVEYFEKYVRPILVEYCYECHSNDERNGGLLLDSRDGLLQGGDTGSAIVEGDVENSLLIEAVRYKNRELQMPPDNQLSREQIAALEKWVVMGAPAPRKDIVSSIVVSGMSVEEGRQFWSFRPIVEPAIPKVIGTHWVKTPIDAFVLSQLQSVGIEPAPPTDRATLIRRMTYDLIGMPPTQRETDAFINDNSVDAVERLINRLLASPQYGVRWGRHWLDVARYADSNGLDENLAFGNAWRYRDYVIQSFNEDKPFDRFLVEQVAGDLLPDASRETKTATGFLVLGAKVLAEPDRDKLTMDTIDEQIDVVGKAFMGMTLGCVRCHDHKFDPIKQKDYYSLAAIFRSTKTFGDSKTGAINHWNEIVFASADELAVIEEVEKRIAEKKAVATKLKNKALEELRAKARSHAVEYLVAATRVQLDMPLTEVAGIAEPLGLHPRILHHCRLHLHYHAGDPFFLPWHRAYGTNHAQLVRSHYQPLFQNVAQAVAAQDGKKSAKLQDERLEMARAAINDNSGFLAVPAKPEFAFDPTTLATYNEAMDEARVFESDSPDVTAVLGVSDADVFEELPIHIRGSHLNLGEPVQRDFPEVMRVATASTSFPNDQSGRLELARWMADAQHPLTARVYANRLWRWHFGSGLVTSTENFGVLGDRPSHPELLDWLAYHLTQNGWSTKQMHRMIMGSSVYQMSCLHPQQSLPSVRDPENRLLWKFPMRRLDAEQIRDAILFTACTLDDSIGGKTVPLRNRQFVFNHTSVDHTKYDSLRRAAYLPVIRNNLYSLFQQFDFPDPTMPTGSRHSTVVAPQALWMMNSELVIDASIQVATELVEDSVSDRSRIEIAYTRVLGRKPSETEASRALSFVDELAQDSLMSSESFDSASMLRAWSLFVQGLYASNEFIYLR